MIDVILGFVLGLLSGIFFSLISVVWLILRSNKHSDPPTKEEWKVM